MQSGSGCRSARAPMVPRGLRRAERCRRGRRLPGRHLPARRRSGLRGRNPQRGRPLPNRRRIPKNSVLAKGHSSCSAWRLPPPSLRACAKEQPRSWGKPPGKLPCSARSLPIRRAGSRSPRVRCRNCRRFFPAPHGGSRPLPVPARPQGNPPRRENDLRVPAVTRPSRTYLTGDVA